MNCAAFPASFGLITEIWFATMPTGKPEVICQINVLCLSVYGSCGPTHDMSRCGDDVRAVLRLEHGQARVIDKSKEDFVHVEGLPGIRVHKREEVLNGIPRSEWLDHVDLWWRPYLQRSHPFPGFLDSIKSKHDGSVPSTSFTNMFVILIRSNLVSKPSRHGMNPGTS